MTDINAVDDSTSLYKHSAQAMAPSLPDETACAEKWSEEYADKPKRQALWQGWSGFAVMAFGVWSPALLLCLGSAALAKRITLVLLNHPLETVIELLLVLAIPLVNYFTWLALRKNDLRFSSRRGILLGGAVATSAIIALTCIAALFWGSAALQAQINTDFSTGFCFLAILGLASSAVSAFLLRQVWATRDFESSRKNVITYAVIGMTLSALTLTVSQIRPFCIRSAEKMATGRAEADRVSGLNWLRQLDAKRNVGMECADSKAAGIAGLFIPVRTSAQHELYFSLTGAPYTFENSGKTNLSSMPDEYVTRHVVGDIVPGLSLVRSALMGTIHPRSYSAKFNWTLVLKNDSDSPQETRAEIQLPPGAVINGMTYWYEGQPLKAAFASAVSVNDSSNNLDASAVQAIATDLGHGRHLIHCNALAPERELKVMITIISPLKPNGVTHAAVVLPRLISSNFDLKGQHQLQLRSSSAITCGAKNLTPAVAPSGDKVLSGFLTEAQLSDSSIGVEAETEQSTAPRVAYDGTAVAMYKEAEARKAAERKFQAQSSSKQQVVLMLDGSRRFAQQLNDLNRAINVNVSKADNVPANAKAAAEIYAVQTIKKIAALPPKRLVVVVDGSQALSEHKEEVREALSHIPANIPTLLLIASQEDPKLSDAMPLGAGLKKLKEMQFCGGQNNLQAVVKAASLAGETDNGAVFWIHGPQPTLNNEMYIMSPYVATPKFYETSIGCGEIDSVDFFKNHSEIGPFLQIPRNESLVADISRFTSRWKSDTKDYEVSYKQSRQRPSQAINLSNDESLELIALRANEECNRLIDLRRTNEAVNYASGYSLVTAVSVAVVNNNPHPANAYKLADNTTPADGAIYVSGVNTAGTVRVNNLANVEALFNVIANLLQVGLGLIGMAILIHAATANSPLIKPFGLDVELGRGPQVIIGLGFIFFALFIPGCINWFIASARDANLFF